MAAAELEDGEPDPEALAVPDAEADAPLEPLKSAVYSVAEAQAEDTGRDSWKYTRSTSACTEARCVGS